MSSELDIAALKHTLTTNVDIKHYLINQFDIFFPCSNVLSSKEFVGDEENFDGLWLGRPEHVLLAVVSAMWVVLYDLKNQLIIKDVNL